MARGNPEKSFLAAVHHLFRHVHDAEELSRNPLGRLFLYDDRGLRIGDELALFDLRSYLERAADAYRWQASADGRTLEGERRRTIVQAILTGRNPTEVAGELGLSLRQYYRDRRAVCMKIGEALTESRPKALPRGTSSDTNDLVLRRAQMLGEAGFARNAEGELERLIVDLPCARTKMRALIELQRVAILAGNLGAATSTLERARTLLPLPGEVADPFLSNAVLLGSIRLARAAGRHQEAENLLVAVEAIELAHAPSDRFSSELALYVLTEISELYCFLGRYAKARHAFERARFVAAQIVHVPVASRVDLAILSFEAFVDTLVGEEEWVARIQNAHDLSLSAGSARGVLISTLAMTNQLANSGAHSQAHGYARAALDIVRQTDCSNMLVRCVASVASAMLPTEHWQMVDPMLFQVETLCNRGSDEWMWIKLSQANLLRRLGEASQAWDAVNFAESEVRDSGNQRVHAEVLRALSVLRASSGHSREAQEYIREAILVGEAAASSVGLYRIYKTAASILDDRRLEHLARQAGEGVRYATEAAPSAAVG